MERREPESCLTRSLGQNGGEGKWLIYYLNQVLHTHEENGKNKGGGGGWILLCCQGCAKKFATSFLSSFWL